MRLDENTGRRIFGDVFNAKNAGSAHHRTNLSAHYAHIFATKARIDNRKKILKQQYVLQMSQQYGNFGPLTAKLCWRIWGIPGNFNGFRVLVALLHGTLQ